MPSDKPKTQSKAQYSNKSIERALIYRELVGEFRPDLINSYTKGALGRKQTNEDDKRNPLFYKNDKVSVEQQLEHIENTYATIEADFPTKQRQCKFR